MADATNFEAVNVRPSEVRTPVARPPSTVISSTCESFRITPPLAWTNAASAWASCLVPPRTMESFGEAA